MNLYIYENLKYCSQVAINRYFKYLVNYKLNKFILNPHETQISSKILNGKVIVHLKHISVNLASILDHDPNAQSLKSDLINMANSYIETGGYKVFINHLNVDNLLLSIPLNPVKQKTEVVIGNISFDINKIKNRNHTTEMNGSESESEFELDSAIISECLDPKFYNSGIKHLTTIIEFFTSNFNLTCRKFTMSYNDYIIGFKFHLNQSLNYLRIFNINLRIKGKQIISIPVAKYHITTNRVVIDDVQIHKSKAVVYLLHKFNTESSESNYYYVHIKQVRININNSYLFLSNININDKSLNINRLNFLLYNTRVFDISGIYYSFALNRFTVNDIRFYFYKFLFPEMYFEFKKYISFFKTHIFKESIRMKRKKRSISIDKIIKVNKNKIHISDDYFNETDNLYDEDTEYAHMEHLTIREEKLRNIHIKNMLVFFYDYRSTFNTSQNTTTSKTSYHESMKLELSNLTLVQYRDADTEKLMCNIHNLVLYNKDYKVSRINKILYNNEPIKIVYLNQEFRKVYKFLKNEMTLNYDYELSNFIKYFISSNKVINMTNEEFNIVKSVVLNQSKILWYDPDDIDYCMLVKPFTMIVSYKPTAIDYQELLNGNKKEIFNLGSIHNVPLKFGKCQIDGCCSTGEALGLIMKQLFSELENNNTSRYLSNIEPFKYFIHIPKNIVKTISQPTKLKKNIGNLSENMFEVVSKTLSKTNKYIKKNTSHHHKTNNEDKLENIGPAKNFKDGIKQASEQIMSSYQHVTRNGDISLKSIILEPIVTLTNVTGKVVEGTYNGFDKKNYETTKNKYQHK
jgi:uncharacterized protein involved in tellurium resistance